MNRHHYPRWVVLMIPILALLFQNFWLWDGDRLILGLPVNLLYHVGFCVLIAAVMFVVVACAWPRYLDKK